jgi:uncharacterized protein YlxW (UPF0749 family)
MVKFKKSSNYKFWHSPLALFILFAAVVFFSYNIVDLAQKSKETSEKKFLILDKIKYLQTKSDNLNKEISTLETDLGKEEELREKLPYAKEGEKMVVIIEEEKREEPVATEEVNSWNRLWSIFKSE